MSDAKGDAFGELNDAETRLVAAAKAGLVLKLRKDEFVRATIVRALACAEDPDWPVAPKGVRLRGGRVEGLLDCSERSLQRPLCLDDADLADGIALTNSRTRTLAFNGSRIGQGFDAQGITIEGGLFLRNATIEGACHVAGATITGQFVADGATFDNPQGHAINAHSSAMSALFLTNATIKGVCNINGATITGHFEALGATFDNPQGDAINAQSSAMSALFLTNATIKGACDVNGATITGPFDAVGATFDNPHGDAINAQSSRIGTFILREASAGGGAPKPVVIAGAINLFRAVIEQQIEIIDARIAGGAAGAIVAHGLEVNGRFLLWSQVTGAVTLSGATIAGRLDLSRSRLASWAAAGRAPGGRIADDPRPFMALDLSEARIGQLVMPDPSDPSEARCARPRGIVDLSRARIGTLTDFAAGWPEPATPRGRVCEGRLRDADGRDADHLVLDGLEYEHLDNPDGDAAGGEAAHAARLRWLRAQSCDDLFTRLRPQPWRHLAKVLAAQGYEEEARRIAIERRVAQRHSDESGPLAVMISWLLHQLADYGFNPWKAVWWSAVAVVYFAIAYQLAILASGTMTDSMADAGLFVRTVPADFVPALGGEGMTKEKLAEVYPAFDPLLYSFDVFLPLFDVGSERFWRANTTTPWGCALYYLTVAEQILGALLVSLIVTGFTGLLTRNEA